jgi:phosphopantothenoylcysteine decarboxylase / phosphopantothenate---cysteine ligase
MRVVVGITGGIAAYKATSIVRLLTEAGHTVKVVPSQNALRFIGAATLEALSHNAVDPDLFTDVADVKHIEIAKSADLVIVAPATASFIARTAAGIADDLLGNVMLATNAPVVIAPAMHTEMWLNSATVNNIQTLRERGITVIEPASGRLTGEDSGVGRLPEPEEIVEQALRALPAGDLTGRSILITAGGTQEAIDPVRFIGNRSSGKQGLAIASEAVRRGARVTLIASNIEEIPEGVGTVIEARTALDVAQAVNEQLTKHDVLVMAAAIADYRIENQSNLKLKRAELGTRISLDLVANPDILKTTVERIKAEGLKVISVGFAAETAGSEDALTRLAQRKLIEKGCDILVANDVSGGAVFGSDSNSVLILTATGSATGRSGSKKATANQLLDMLVESFK